MTVTEGSSEGETVVDAASKEGTDSLSGEGDFVSKAMANVISDAGCEGASGALAVGGVLGVRAKALWFKTR